MIRAPLMSASTHLCAGRCQRGVRRAIAGTVVLVALSLAGASAASAARSAAATDLQITPGVGVISTSWSVTTSSGLTGFVLGWRPMTVPESPWGKPLELGAGARSYDITRLRVGIYEVRVRALIRVRRKVGRRTKILKRPGGATSGAATTFSAREEGPPPSGEPPHELERPKASEAPMVEEIGLPKEERPRGEEPPKEEPPKEEPPKEEPPKEEPPAEEPPKEEPPKEEPPKEEPPAEEPPKEEPPKEEPPAEEPPKEEEASAKGCVLYASPSGSDANDGTQAAPLLTVHALLDRLTAGQTGCLARGSYTGFTQRSGESHGAAGSRVTITSSDPQAPARISGRVVTMPGADWLTFSHLIFTDSVVTPPSITIGSAHTSWIWDDVSAAKTICISPVGVGAYGPARHTLIEHDRIHNCGRPFTCICSQPPENGYYIHGIYDLGNFTTIRNNYIYDNASKGVLLRGGKGAIVEHNVIDGNGSGVMFGDLTPEGDTVAWNLITNSRGICESCSDYLGIWTFGSLGLFNMAVKNDVFGNASGNIGPHGILNLAENIEVDPRYVDAAKHEYALRPDSPVLGYGPQ